MSDFDLSRDNSIDSSSGVYNPQTFEDLISYNLSFLNGTRYKTVYHSGPVDQETEPYLSQLIKLQHLGILTTCSQPGYLRKNGFRQKPYLEFYVDPSLFPVFKKLELKGYNFLIINSRKEEVYRTPNFYLPYTLTSSTEKPPYNTITSLPDTQTLFSVFDHTFGSWSHILKDYWLVEMVYPKFWHQSIFDDLLEDVISFQNFEKIKKTLKNKVKIVALTGKMGSGKDYIANNYILPILSAQGKVSLIGFADVLKIESLVNYEADPDKVFGQRDSKTRKLLQSIGDEYKYKYGQDYWVRNTFVSMYSQYIRNKITNFVITDCRFPNEIQYLKDIGAKIIKIDAPTRTSERIKSELLDQLIFEHNSEKMTDNIPIEHFDLLIQNDPENKIDTDILTQILQ